MPPAEPTSVSAFMNLAKPSTTKKPPMGTAAGAGGISTATQSPARSASAMRLRCRNRRARRGMAPISSTRRDGAARSDLWQAGRRRAW